MEFKDGYDGEKKKEKKSKRGRRRERKCEGRKRIRMKERGR